MWASTDYYLKTTAIVSFLVALLNRPIASVVMNTVTGFSPLWALVPVGLFFLFGLMKANHEKFQEVEQERDELEAKNSEIEAERVQGSGQNQGAVLMVEDEGKLQIIDGYVQVTGFDTPILKATNKADVSLINFASRTSKDSAAVPAMNAARRWYSERISDEELAQRCRELSREISEFSEIRERSSPLEKDSPESPSPGIVQKEMCYREDTKSQYRQLFFGRAIALLYAAAERNAYSSEELARLEWSPIMRQTMEETAQWLAAIGCRP